MADNFANHMPGLSAPASRAFAITPNDSTDLATTTRALQATTGAGLAYIDTVGGDSNVAVYLPLGVPLPIRATRVRSTSTTATGIVGLA